MAESQRRRKVLSDKQKYEAARRAAVKADPKIARLEALRKQFEFGASGQYTQADMASDLFVVGATQSARAIYDDVQDFESTEPEAPAVEKLGEISHTPVRSDATPPHELQEGPVFDAIIIIEDDDI